VGERSAPAFPLTLTTVYRQKYDLKLTATELNVINMMRRKTLLRECTVELKKYNLVYFLATLCINEADHNTISTYICIKLE